MVDSCGFDNAAKFVRRMRLTFGELLPGVGVAHARLTAMRSWAPPGPYLGDVGLAELLDADMRVLAAGRR